MRILSKYDIAIVGGSGFIGSSLVRYIGDSFRVKVLDIHRIPKVLETRVDFQLCDIRKYDEIKRELQNVEVVIHTAIIQLPLINEEKKLGYEVNILGTQNLCKATERIQSIQGLLLTGSWHVFGERGLKGIIDEGFGFRPDKIEQRAFLYGLCKIGQEVIVRVFDEMSEKIYGTIRIGTVLGEYMPKKTAANIFISEGLRGNAITPYKHSMHRPMLYVDINNVCEAFRIYAKKISNGEVSKEDRSTHIINLSWSEPVTILELAEIVRNSIIKYTEGEIKPEISIVDTGKQDLYTHVDKEVIKIDINKAKNLLNIKKLISPKQSIDRIIKKKISEQFHT